MQSPIHSVALARVPRHRAQMSIDPCRQVPQSLDLPRPPTNPRADRRPRASPIVTTSWISLIPRGRLPLTAQTPSARRNTLLRSSAPYAPSASPERTIFDRICEHIRMSGRSFAVFAAKHSLASMTGSGTRAYIRERRSLSAAAT